MAKSTPDVPYAAEKLRLAIDHLRIGYRDSTCEDTRHYIRAAFRNCIKAFLAVHDMLDVGEYADSLDYVLEFSVGDLEAWFRRIENGSYLNTP